MEAQIFPQSGVGFEDCDQSLYVPAIKCLPVSKSAKISCRALYVAPSDIAEKLFMLCSEFVALSQMSLLSGLFHHFSNGESRSRLSRWRSWLLCPLVDRFSYTFRPFVSCHRADSDFSGLWCFGLCC
jgi:hypothetical protein